MLKIQEGVAMWKVYNSNFKVSFGSERKYLGKEMLVQKRSLHLSDAEKITEIKSNVNLQILQIYKFGYVSSQLYTLKRRTTKFKRTVY